MKKLLLIVFLSITLISCASLNFDSNSQGARLGVKAATMVLIEKEYLTQEELAGVVDLSLRLLNEDSTLLNEGLENFIRKQIAWEDLSAPAKLAVDEFLITLRDNIEVISIGDTLEQERKVTLVILNYVKDTLELYK